MFFNVRRTLEPFYRFVQEYKIAAILSRHLLYKGRGKTAAERGVGSYDITNLCRSNLLVGPDPEDADRRVLVHTASNVAEKDIALGFTPIKDRVPELSARTGYWVLARRTAVRVEWFDCPNYKEEEVLGTKAGSKLDACLRWLRGALKQKPLYSHEVRAQAAANGFSWRLVESAKVRLRVRSVRQPWTGAGPGSHSLWTLP
jgi:hypothetical protein